MIKEEDCDVQMPSPTSDDFIDEGRTWTPASANSTQSVLLSTIHVIGPIARLLRLLRSPRISIDSIQAYDAHFEQVMQRFPARFQLSATDYIEPAGMMPVFYLQNAKLILHRHNLSPICDQQSRSQALTKCTEVAKVTAKYLRRCMQHPPSPETSDPAQKTPTWEERFVAGVSAFLCTHIWRCTMFLLFRGEFDSALTCARASAVLADSRLVNTACGKYLDFFLSQFIVKSRHKVNLDTDEELIAYVSGDQQSNFQNSWVWHEDNDRNEVSKPLDCEVNGDAVQGHTTNTKDTLQDKEAAEWAGWDKIVTLIQELADEQKRLTATEPHPTGGAVSPLSVHMCSLAASPSASVPTTRDRLSIRDLL